MRVRKAVFPAAGLGTRFLPATKAQPKEMLPLVDKPAIQYVVEEAVDSGIEDIIIVTGRGKTAIEDHFDHAFELETILERRGDQAKLDLVRRISDMARISYVRQKEALGLGHAILVARELVGDEPFAVFLGDDLIDAPVPAMKQMLEQFERLQAPVIALEEVDRQRTRSYGVIAGTPDAEDPRVYALTDLVEKPDPKDAPSNLAIIGRYILTADIFTHLDRTRADGRGEIQLTDALRSRLEDGPLYGYRFEGTRYDTGNKLGFLKATVELALKRKDLGGDFREYLAGLKP